MLRNEPNIKVKIKRVDGISIPQRGNCDDAAYDIIAIADPEIVGENAEMAGDIFAVPGFRQVDKNLWTRIDFIRYKTNLHIEVIADNCQKFAVTVYPRSSICKHNLRLKNSIGLIDPGYRGEIMMLFDYCIQPEDIEIDNSLTRMRFFSRVNSNRIYKKGDKIGQIRFESVRDVEFELVDELSDSQRGSGGFGSTGK